MGVEAKGTLMVGGQKVPVQADFGSDRVLFSGGRRGPVPYKNIEVLGTARGKLKLRVDGSLMEFDIGAKVDRLANKIRTPPSRLQKMGVKAGMTAAIIEGDDRFLEELRQLIPDVIEGRPPAPVDLVILGVDDIDSLGAIPPLIRHVKPTGGLWVIYPKASKHLKELQVLEAGRKAGLKDMNMMRFTMSHSAVKFVIPYATDDESDLA